MMASVRLWILPHNNQHASDEPPLKSVSEEVRGVTWLCDTDKFVVECNPEANGSIRPVEQHGVKNLSLVTKGRKQANKVPCTDLARRNRKEKKPKVAESWELL